MGSILSLTEQHMHKKTAPHKRNLALWMVYVGFILLCLAGFLRLQNSILNWYWLNFAGVRPGPWYLAFSGGLWGLVGLAALIWLWFTLPWHRQVGAGAALFFGLSYWIDRLFIGNPQGSLPNFTFSAILTLLGLVFVFFVLRPWATGDEH